MTRTIICPCVRGPSTPATSRSALTRSSISWSGRRESVGLPLSGKRPFVRQLWSTKKSETWMIPVPWRSTGKERLTKTTGSRFRVSMGSPSCRIAGRSHSVARSPPPSSSPNRTPSTSVTTSRSALQPTPTMVGQCHLKLSLRVSSGPTYPAKCWSQFLYQSNNRLRYLGNIFSAGIRVVHR